MAFRNCLQRLQQSAATQLASAGSSRSFAANALVDQEAALWRSPAAVLHGDNDLRFEDVSMPERVAEGSCRVEMKAVGICGSDVHFWKKVQDVLTRDSPATVSSLSCSAAGPRG